MKKKIFTKSELVLAHLYLKLWAFTLKKSMHFIHRLNRETCLKLKLAVHMWKQNKPTG